MQESLLMDDSDSDENILFGEKETKKLTSTHDQEESDWKIILYIMIYPIHLLWFLL